jgi:hypothetical protein
MKTETRHEQFEPPSVLGNLLRKLHIDIPLFIGLFLTSLLSFAILYSAGSQEMDILIRQARSGRLGFSINDGTGAYRSLSVQTLLHDTIQLRRLPADCRINHGTDRQRRATLAGSGFFSFPALGNDKNHDTDDDRLVFGGTPLAAKYPDSCL